MNNFDFYRDFKRSSHQMIIDYFNKYGFGTNMPVLTYLSILAPIDRCVILENLFDINRLNSILSDKLLLAYVTSGKKELARLVIENSIRNGESELNVWALESKLDLGLAPFRNRDQRLALYNDFLCKTESILEIEFLNILIQFCKDSYE